MILKKSAPGSPAGAVLSVLLIAAASLSIGSPAFGASSCPPLRHGYGPYDYRTATPDQRRLVEGAHFFSAVENLESNAKHPSKGYIVVPGSEIDYTLRAFPNHMRALYALARLGIRDNTDSPPGVKAPIPCYFENSVTFRPDDVRARVIYGIYLAKRGRPAEAIEQLKIAKEAGELDANTSYNMGLILLDLGRKEEALEAAHHAYRLGFPLPGLKNRLQREGAWREPIEPIDGDAQKNESSR